MVRPITQSIAYIVLLCVVPLFSYAQQGAFTLADWPSVSASMKPLYVKAIIEQAGVNKVALQMPVDFYVNELDRFATYSREHELDNFLTVPLAQNVATLAVVHCDWNNGVDPYEFAQKYLGKQLDLLAGLYPRALQKLENHCQ